MTDNINQPAHYTAGGIETIDVIEGVLNKYDHRDQVEKYNQRAHLKGNFQQDLEKARWYLNRTIENCENGKLDPVTGARVDTAEEKSESFYATDLDTSAVYLDETGDTWVWNSDEEAWYFYVLRGGSVLRKSVRGFTQADMCVFSRDFFSRVGYKQPFLTAIERFEEREREEAPQKFDTGKVHKDNDGDYWVFNPSTQEWKWYTLSGDLGTVFSFGGAFTAEELERNFESDFIELVEDEEIARKVRDAVKEHDNPQPKEIVLGETDPADMPVGTVAYRDGAEYAYYARKEVDGWSLSTNPFFLYPDGIAENWFKFEKGWSLDAPTDVYIDMDGDYWADMGDGWRWHYINDGVLEYTSIRRQTLEAVKDIYSLEKLNDREALRVRRIIKEGEK